MKMKLVVAGLLVATVALVLAPAVVGWHTQAQVDALGWANYILLGAKLGLGALAVGWYALTRGRGEDEA
jgi:hypothetical protein